MHLTSAIALASLAACFTAAHGDIAVPVANNRTHRALHIGDIYTVNGVKYQELSTLGEGSFGKVIKARTRDNEIVAVKIQLEHSGSLSLLQLMTEIHILQHLAEFSKSHHYSGGAEAKHVLMYIDHGYKDDVNYLVTDFAGGGSLFELLCSNGRMKESVVISMLKQLAEGMRVLFLADVVHRDLKPENIMFTTDGTLKIIDFGLATVLPPGKSTADVAGSPFYMAPEIFRHAAYDGKVDMWSIGVILYSMLVFEYPFMGNDPWEVLEDITEYFRRYDTKPKRPILR